MSTKLLLGFPGLGPLAGADGGTTQSMKNSLPCSAKEERKS